MAWMPVAEAAATLGVSERTIWRRIKSGQVPSHSESGRTLVTIDDPQSTEDPVRQLSHVAAAQLSMRKLDAEAVSDVLAVVADYRTSFDVEIARSRRAGRWWAALAACLVLALGAGGWYHLDRIDRMEDRQYEALADLNEAHTGAIGDLRENASHAAGLAEARQIEVTALRSSDAERRQQLTAVEASRTALQATVDERLAALQQTYQAQQAALASYRTDVDRLNTMIVQLQTRLHDQETKHQIIRKQSERATAAIRRTAARHAGVAEGMRILAQQQQGELIQTRHALAAAHRGDGVTDVPLESRAAITKESLLRAVVGDSQDASTALPETGGWRSLIYSWMSAWLSGPGDAVTPSELASAE